MDFLKYLFDTSRFMPRRTCGLWQPWEVWLHNVSDLVIWISYLVIPFALLYFIRKKPKIGFPFIFYCFIAFIVSCGFTHFMDFLMFYYPAYALAGFVKLVTALISASTVVVLCRHLPQAISIKTPAELEEAIQQKTVENQQTIANLRAVETQLQIVINNTPALISLVDKDFIYRQVNQTYEDWFGLPTVEIVGKSMEDILGTRVWQHLKPRFNEAVTTKQVVKFELWAEYIHGGSRWISVNYAPHLDPKGEVDGVIVLVSDITQKKHLEEQLSERVRELGEINQRKDEFLAILGHELRNPLAAINNAIQLLTLPNVPEDARLSSGMILTQQIEHVGRLVDDIITVSRAVRGKIEIHREDVHLCEVVERAVQIVEPLIEARRHKLNVTLCSPPLTITGDKIRLVQVVANLLNNSAKYTNDGGTISISCKRDGDDAVILVKDNGIGISPEVMPHIFELCVRGRRATQKDHGMGIGLTMVKTIVELHGGTAEARSEGSDKGTEFSVTIPIKEGIHDEDSSG